MKRDRWVWMPDPGHFICSRDCRFHLNTYVGGYIVSTVGELLVDAPAREIIARSRGVTLEGIGDARLADYMKKIGYDTIGCDRLYETMVFKASRDPQNACCPWRQISGESVDFAGFNEPGDAHAGHMKLCAKWARRGDL